MEHINVILITAAAAVTLIAVYALKTEANNPDMPAEVPVPANHDSDLKSELTEFRNALARLHDMASRHDERTEDAFRDMNRRVDRIERGVERIENHQETEARIGSALARMGRPTE